MLIFVIMSILVLIIFSYAYFVEPFKLEVKSVTVSNELGLKILHFSDIHYGKSFNDKQLAKVISEINKLDCDLVIFTGDLFTDSYNGDVQSLISLLKLIKCDNKFAIWGNHDYKYFAFKHFDHVLKSANFTVLRNESTTVNIDGKILNIVGSDDYIMGENEFDVIQSLSSLNEYNLLLLHEPDVAKDYVQLGFNLILSGHSHGGQVVLPFNIKGQTRLGSEYVSGLYTLSNKTNLYVSSGLGTSGIRLRFRAVPSITIIEI